MESAALQPPGGQGTDGVMVDPETGAADTLVSCIRLGLEAHRAEARRGSRDCPTRYRRGGEAAGTQRRPARRRLDEATRALAAELLGTGLGAAIGAADVVVTRAVEERLDQNLAGYRRQWARPRRSNHGVHSRGKRSMRDRWFQDSQIRHELRP